MTISEIKEKIIEYIKNLPNDSEIIIRPPQIGEITFFADGTQIGELTAEFKIVYKGYYQRANDLYSNWEALQDER